MLNQAHALFDLFEDAFAGVCIRESGLNECAAFSKFIVESAHYAGDNKALSKLKILYVLCASPGATDQFVKERNL